MGDELADKDEEQCSALHQRLWRKMPIEDTLAWGARACAHWRLRAATRVLHRQVAVCMIAWGTDKLCEGGTKHSNKADKGCWWEFHMRLGSDKAGSCAYWSIDRTVNLKE